MRLVDFADPGESSRWRAIDDVIMGGRSSSAMLAGDGFGIFAGEVVLDGGGFASVRRADDPVDVSSCDAIELRIRGDGRRYKLNLRTSDSFEGVVYQAAFATEPGRWLVAKLALTEFVPRHRGRPAAGSLDPARLCSLGLLVSDRQEGPFRLEIASIVASTRVG